MDYFIDSILPHIQFNIFSNEKWQGIKRDTYIKLIMPIFTPLFYFQTSILFNKNLENLDIKNKNKTDK